MIIGVVILIRQSLDDAARASIFYMRSRHGVFAVVTMLTARQDMLPIAENDTVLCEGEGPPALMRCNVVLTSGGKSRIDTISIAVFFVFA